MAERKISGNDVFLFIDVTGGTSNYDTVVCLTSKSLKRTTSTIDAASQCGPDKLAGTQDISVDFEGQILLDPDTNKISGAYLHDVWADKRTISWKLSPVTPVDGDVIYTGSAFLSDLSDTYSSTEPSTFSGTLAVKGTISRVVEGS